MTSHRPWERKWRVSSVEDPRTYRAWQSMRSRCYLISDISFPHYGGRGITVCDQWRENYDNFYEDMGPCPENFSIDRKDTNGNYGPENCHWIPKVEQAKNRRFNHIIYSGGVMYTPDEFSKKFRVNLNTLYSRLRKNAPMKVHVLEFDL